MYIYLADTDILNTIENKHDIMLVGATQLPMNSVPITTKVAILNPVHAEVYLIQHYVIKCVSDL